MFFLYLFYIIKSFFYTLFSCAQFHTVHSPEELTTVCTKAAIKVCFNAYFIHHFYSSLTLINIK